MVTESEKLQCEKYQNHASVAMSEKKAPRKCAGRSVLVVPRFQCLRLRATSPAPSEPAPSSPSRGNGEAVCGSLPFLPVLAFCSEVLVVDCVVLWVEVWSGLLWPACPAPV